MKLREMLNQLHVDATDEMLAQFQRYYELLIQWNGFMNLTGITDYDEVNCKHFADSLSLVKTVEMDKTKKIIDIGTGAGFPGLPVKIAFPKTEVTLLDSLGKRVKFLNTVIDELQLLEIKAVHGRAEDYARQMEYREQYDLCVSRAVANLAALSEYCLPYVKPGGYFIAYKSGDADTEIEASKKAITLLGGEIESVEKFLLPGSDIARSLVKIKKIKQTPKKYPRKAGTPTREPLH